MSSRSPESLLPLRPLVFDFLLLLNHGEWHGYGLMQKQNDRGGKQVLGPGTLYRTLKEMQRHGLIEPVPDDEVVAEEGTGGPDRRYYRITPFGRQVAAAEANRMASLVGQARAGKLLG